MCFRGFSSTFLIFILSTILIISSSIFIKTNFVDLADSPTEAQEFEKMEERIVDDYKSN